jgi:hypothetical protein
MILAKRNRKIISVTGNFFAGDINFFFLLNDINEHQAQSYTGQIV